MFRPGVRLVQAALLFAGIMPIRSAQALDCSDPTSTVEMNRCAERDFAAADRRLNAAYRKALASLPRMSGDPPFDADRWERALRQSQRAWIAYRDRECKDHVAMFWTGGTGTTVAVLACMTNKSNTRAKELDEHYAPR